MIWYSFEPQDTLYFRGGEPSNIGENHTASTLFPPAAHTIAGALRTTALIQNDISFEEYGSDKFKRDDIIKAIGKAGDSSPFNLTGPLFIDKDGIWLPCPYTWFREKDDNNSTNIQIYKSKPYKSSIIKTKNIEKLRWIKGKEVETLGGSWVNIKELYSDNDKKVIKKSIDFYVKEIHTGIALDQKNRRITRKHHLYSFVHSRLNNGVKLIFGIDKALPLKDKGALKLGAEQRFGQYEKIENISFKPANSGMFMSMSIIEGTDEANQEMIATGKIQYFGGWDMHKGFHKPMKGYFASGSVFKKKINHNFIEL